MKNDEMLMLMGLLVAGAYLATKPRAAQAAAPGGATEIKVPGNTNGWRYFSNGVAISPDGTYYQGGDMVWNPMM